MRGQAIPPNADPAHVEHLTATGFLKPITATI